LTIQIRKRGVRGIDVRPEFTRVGDDVIIASTLRVNENGPWQERYQVLHSRRQDRRHAGLRDPPASRTVRPPAPR
jgi:hypothetical protein